MLSAAKDSTGSVDFSGVQTVRNFAGSDRYPRFKGHDHTLAR